MRPSKHKKSFSDCLKGMELLNVILNALTGQRSLNSWSSSEGWSAERVITWALNGVYCNFWTYPSLGFRTTLESLGPNAGFIERACKLLPRLTDASGCESTCHSDPVKRTSPLSEFARGICFREVILNGRFMRAWFSSLRLRMGRRPPYFLGTRK